MLDLGATRANASGRFSKTCPILMIDLERTRDVEAQYRCQESQWNTITIAKE
jgi:hypothetical protein